MRRIAALMAFVSFASPATALAGGGVVCTISTASIAFGSYNVFGASSVTANGTLDVTCTRSSTPIVVSLNVGANATTFAPRYLFDGTDRLAYNIFVDAAYATIFGDGTGTTQTVSTIVPTKNVAFGIPLYGQILPNQDVGIGSYADTVVATVNF